MENFLGPTLRNYLILVSINMDSLGMREDYVVCCNKRLKIRVPIRTVAIRCRAATRRVCSLHITKFGHHIRLIEGSPELHLVTQLPKADFSKVHKFFPAKHPCQNKVRMKKIVVVLVLQGLISTSST